ncbi:UTP--glucose-1-phosphate uridylyltransferase GalU [Staphylospora marina]|uniref:UTP--glucose-1-phosphate uridylyltransferase GalU n=1 Tax=Staphylospora marina TaxID=2490858 RepID=UPI000F5BDBBE|nr:UTP--glucose-1-phosphate uridylyltransferase GalU [Staphylospora marina]
MSKKVRKAIIPAAGLGTRFLPATKAMPKEMLPIVDKPTIQYIVEEAVQSGIQEIIIVTGKSKRAIEDHFDKNFELEFNLAQKNKEDLLKLVRTSTDLANIYYVRQKEALGLGHAISCAREFIGDEPFAVLLGDMIMDGRVPCLKRMIDLYEENGAGVIAVQQVPWEEVHKYGVISGERIGGKVSRIDDLVEKPKEHPPSNLAIIGRYILEADIFDILDRTMPGAGGEIQLTDALRVQAAQKPLIGYEYEGRVFDVGSKLGFLQATVEFAARNEELMDSFMTWLHDFVSARSSMKTKSLA